MRMRLLRVGQVCTGDYGAGGATGSALDRSDSAPGAAESPRPGAAGAPPHAEAAGRDGDRACTTPQPSASCVSVATSPIAARAPAACDPGSRDAGAEAARPRAVRPHAVRPEWGLKVRVAAACNLPRATGVGMWSCFCVVRVGRQERRTALCHGGGGSDMGWADACIDLSVFDRSQRLSLSLMSYNGAETRELGSAKITPALDAKETSRWLPLLGVNGRILYGRDGARCRPRAPVLVHARVRACVVSRSAQHARASGSARLTCLDDVRA